LIRANLNDMIDRAEDPEKMIKQVILDMENQYLQVKTQVAVSIADQHMLEKKWKENEDTGNDWMRKASVQSIRAKTIWRAGLWTAIKPPCGWRKAFANRWTIRKHKWTR